MYSNFKEKAIEFVKQAVAEDNAGNHQKAFELYMTAIDYFCVHLKYEKNSKAKEAITAKLKEYMTRAEDLKKMIGDQGGSAPSDAPPPSNGPGPAAGTKPKPPGGGGGESNDEKDKLRSSLGSSVMEEKPNIKWDDVAGLEGAKDALKEAVILPVKLPQFFTGKRKPWSGILLYGPPGTGKSYLAKAVATEADSTFFSVSSSDLVSKWLGESEKLVNQLFQMAREKSPSIVFIDEIDALCSARGEGESEAARRIKTEFLVQIQGVNSTNARVLVLGATNLPYSLDSAIRRRFDKRIYIPLPEAQARAHMFKVHLGDTPHNLTQRDFDALGKKTEGFSGSDVSVVVKDVLMEPVRKTQDATHFRVRRGPDGGQILEPCSSGDQAAFPATLTSLISDGRAADIRAPDISMRDFEKVLLRARPTVSQTDLKSYEQFTSEFGEDG